MLLETVRIVGRLNVDLYSCVAADITTDEVVITEERILHIREKHPGDYERYMQYMAQIIEEPDYILAANRPNTAFILKKIAAEGKQFEIILRLKVVGDPQEYRNSIITFLKIEDKKWKKYLRNKKVLYSRE